MLLKIFVLLDIITMIISLKQIKQHNSVIISPMIGKTKVFSSSNKFESETVKDRPFSLPPGEFRPKQSLGQNFLSDQNYVMKIVDAFATTHPNPNRVVEIGPGAGALTRVLTNRYSNMTAIEIDQRAVAFLNEKLPSVNVIRADVLDVDWQQLAQERGGRVSVIANLPYNIVSQVLFSLADAYGAIDHAVCTMQWEVGERMIAKPRTKPYGIPSVVFQLYCKPSFNFKIPPKVFFPVPKVDSALVTFDFTRQHPDLKHVNGNDLRR
jgi:ribosomal RNA small subunit methyltransferase A